MTITIELTEQEYGELLTCAMSQSLSAESMAKQCLLNDLERNKHLKSAMEFVLQKNAELYRRLAQ